MNASRSIALSLAATLMAGGLVSCAGTQYTAGGRNVDFDLGNGQAKQYTDLSVEDARDVVARAMRDQSYTNIEYGENGTISGTSPTGDEIFVTFGHFSNISGEISEGQRIRYYPGDPQDQPGGLTDGYKASVSTLMSGVDHLTALDNGTSTDKTQADYRRNVRNLNRVISAQAGASAQNVAGQHQMMTPPPTTHSAPPPQQPMMPGYR